MKFKLNKKNMKNLSDAPALNKSLTPKVGGGYAKEYTNYNGSYCVPDHSGQFTTCRFSDLC